MKTGQLPVVRREGHRLDSRQRESSLNQVLTADSRLLRCPQVAENARMRALFSIFPRRARKSRTAWRREGDSNSRDPSDSWSEFGGAPDLRESESHSLCSLSGRRSLRARMRTVFCSVRVCFFRLEPVVVYFSLPLPSAFQAVRSLLHPDP